MFATLWIAMSVQAQTESPSRWSITTWGYANLTTIPQHRSIYFQNSHAGFGVFTAYRFQPRFDLRLGLKANTLAYSRNATNNLELFIQRTREYYFETPLSVFFYPSRTERTWGFYTGVTPSVLMNKFVSQRENNPQYALVPPDPSDVGRMDWGINMGASVKLNPRLSMGADFTYSLTNKQAPAYNSGKFSQFSIGLGYQITAPNKKESEIISTEKEEIIPFKKDKTVILVRLRTDHKRMRFYEENGYTQDAEELREALKVENETTMEAFRKGFVFCPVYFFYDTLSTQIREEHYDSILWDEEGKQVFTAPIGDTTDILIAEFTSPHSEAFGTSTGFGLVIFDYQFNQMKSPFPYYVPTYYGLVSRKEVVARFERRLREYLRMK
ncbi:MAG: PorT family protein [Bacteroidota bacterium]|nr:PorT family protein [Bacteroidota bacterium]MDX5431714.1 PorT family protein [Bacteroidota bacterium]MDX5470429.1 PorT family protein [Bacteroidota bacterium]